MPYMGNNGRLLSLPPQLLARLQRIRRIVALCLGTVLLLFMPLSSAAETLQGEVVSISDGDTLTILIAAKQQIKVRLAEIDTPESRQPYGTAARQALAAKVFRKNVRVVVDTVDRYGRQVGHIYLGSRNINREMVEEGHAWAYRRYLKDQSLLTLESRAKANSLGLWALSEARNSPPWEWRRQQRAGKAVADKSINAATTGIPDSVCGSKRYCREMLNCSEAKFYLQQCGLGRLDGDGDGVPCEAICR